MNSKNFLSVPLTLMLLAGMPWCTAFATDDVSEPIQADSGDHFTVGNVTVDSDVDDCVMAVKVRARGEGSDDKDASVKVNGSVNITNEGETYGVSSWGDKGNASVDISENVIVNTQDSGYGVETDSTDNGISSVKVGGNVSIISTADNQDYSSVIGVDALRKSSVDVGGNVLAQGPLYAWGVSSSDADVKVGGDIVVNGANAMGVMASAASESTVDVGGGISVNGYYVNGVTIYADDRPEVCDIAVRVAKGITATSTGNALYNGASGIAVSNRGGKHLVDVIGDVVVKSDNGSTCGLMIGDVNDFDLFSNQGKATVKVHGNLISDNVGIYLNNVGQSNTTPTDVLVEDVIKAKNVGIKMGTAIIGLEEAGVGSDEIIEPSNYNLSVTTWKIDLAEEGNVAEFERRVTTPIGGGEEGGIQTIQAKNFEKNNVMYIIKLEQPTEGATLSVVDKDGNALAQSYGYDVAHEGDKILLKVNLKKGFQLIGAYNGDGEKIPLLVDANGNYYLIVPKFGGVYISAKLRRTPNKESSKKSDDNKETASEDKSIQSEERITYIIDKLNASLNTSQTGDDNRLSVWLLISALSIGSVAALEVYERRKGSKPVKR